MKNFSLVPTSEGPRREFKITWGLRAGYGPSGRIYDLEEAIRAAHRWMRERDARAEPFLSGMFTRGEVVYAGSETEAAHDREPVAIFTGEVLPHYAADMDDDAVRILLNDLASEIGGILEQEEVHVAYRLIGGRRVRFDRDIDAETMRRVVSARGRRSMMLIPAGVKVHLALGYTDLRKGIDGLGHQPGDRARRRA